MLHRDYELRDAQVSGRTLVLAMVPFDSPTMVADGDGVPYLEAFRPGAFAHLDPTRTQLRYRHSSDLLDRLGSGVQFREDGGWLLGDFRVSAGQRGDHLLDLVGSGDLRGVSIGFDAGIDEQDGDVTRRVRVKRLLETSLVDQPAYADASVLAVRAEQAAAMAARDRARDELAAWVRDMRQWCV